MLAIPSLLMRKTGIIFLQLAGKADAARNVSYDVFVCDVSILPTSHIGRSSKFVLFFFFLLISGETTED